MKEKQDAALDIEPSIHQYTSQDIKIIEKKPLYNGYFSMNKYRFKHKLFNGEWSSVVDREVFERGHAAVVLPYDPNLETFVLIEQVRIGALETYDKPWLVECVAGIIDEGETAEEVCVREAVEEAGLTIKKLLPAMSYLASPGGTTEKLDVFVGLIDASSAGGVYGLDDEDEDILVHKVSEKTARDWLNQGKIINSATIIALQWFFLNRDKVLNEFR
ncbi:ADP-ribose diphosphatase [Alteromonadaceae bacterium M269]|nr:ADP-ribose diphosphatase [Alteromonadaceae bacterium M269]